MSEGRKGGLASWLLAVAAYFCVIVSVPMLLAGSFAGPHVLVAGGNYLAIGIIAWVAYVRQFAKSSG